MLESQAKDGVLQKIMKQGMSMWSRLGSARKASAPSQPSSRPSQNTQPTQTTLEVLLEEAGASPGNESSDDQAPAADKAEPEQPASDGEGVAEDDEDELEVEIWDDEDEMEVEEPEEAARKRKAPSGIAFQHGTLNLACSRDISICGLE